MKTIFLFVFAAFIGSGIGWYGCKSIVVYLENAAYDKGYQAGYAFAIEERYIPAPGLEKIKKRNANLIQKFRG